METPKALPSAFDSIRAHSNCTCSFCWAVWEAIDKDSMDEKAWSDYAVHLKDKHGWDNSEETA